MLPGTERLAALSVKGVVFIVLFVGLSNLTVWLIPPLRSLVANSGLMVMRVNAAVSMIALALSLGFWFRGAGHTRPIWPALTCSAVAVLIGGITTLEYLINKDLLIDTLFPATFVGDLGNNSVVSSGRMSLNTSLSLFFLGLALLCIDRRGRLLGRSWHVTPALTFLGTLPPCLGLVGYLLEQGGFTGILKSTNILLHVAASLVLLAVGTVTLRPHRPPLRGILSAGAEGILLRWLLPGSTLALVLLTCLIGEALAHDHIGPGEGIALMLFGGVTLLFLLILAASSAVREQAVSAEKASMAKDDFLATLSHELRTPLTPVLLSASTLRGDHRLPEDVRRELAMIERNIALEARLIDDLLDLTRIANGKMQIRRELCDMHSLLGHALEIVHDEARERSLEIKIELEARKRGIHGDSARLQQVLWNLLKNAVKFTPSGGHIVIRSWNDPEDGGLVIEVGDNGIGFGSDTKRRLFLPFEQGMRAVGNQPGGLGLGLTIARAIVDLHGGQITGESEGHDKGATFRVRLPEAQLLEPHPASNGTSVSDRSVRGDSLKILLVEDHEATRKTLSILLKRSGHTVKTAGTVADALLAGRMYTFDVIISDLGLPDGTGLDLLPKLRAHTSDLKAIALSGYGMEEDLRRSAEAGFAIHLVKPVQFEHLKQALHQVSGHQQ